MLRHLGYVGQSLSLSLTSGRGTVLRNATPERLRTLIRENLRALARILAFNASHSVFMFRVSSRIIPFASHPVNRLRGWVEFERELSEVGDFVRGTGMRVSMHPGQHTVLSSPDYRIVQDSFRDLEWHCRFLEAMLLGPDHKVVIHGGGGYGDKQEALERLLGNFRRLPDRVRARLVLENDERVYTAEDLLALSERIGAPVVFDWLHHQVNPGTSPPVRWLVERCFATWEAVDGLPKVHFSSQAPGKRPGAHADYVDPQQFLRFYEQVRDLDFDCMLEAKAKDLALFRLREELSWLPLAA